jgi:endonuclease/exonuclease/phosphatase family metal-dependent hydrolase
MSATAVVTTYANDATTARPRTWKWRVAVGLALAGLVWIGTLRMAAGPASGRLEVERPMPSAAATEPARLRIGTYNIHGGRGTDGVHDLDRIADVLRGADFVGLNEVHGPSPWRSGNQATTLGEKLGLTPLYAPAEDPLLTGQFGNGLLTRVPIDHWQVVPLARQYDDSYRNLIHVQARAANGTPVNIVVTHLVRSNERERREQLRTVVHYFLALAEPAVLLGDLNSVETDSYLQLARLTPGVVDALGQKFGDQTPPHIDWVLVRGAKVTDAGLTPVGPSDHPHVWAEIEIPPVRER